MCPQLSLAPLDTLTLSKFNFVVYNILIFLIGLILKKNNYLTNTVRIIICLCFRYSITNRLHEKSDVYSFGVVLLEMVTGRPAIVRSHEKAHISQWVNFVLANGDIRSVVDQRLNGDFETNSAWKAVEIAMACVSPTSAKRPTMNQVVTELQDCLAAELSRKNNDSLMTDSTTSIETFSIISPTTEFSPLAR